jgi:hypothetical protein
MKKKLIERLRWICDYYLVYFLYSTNKVERYHKWMKKKWGEKYKDSLV